ncbi:hypothetical protein OA07_17035 [Aphanizomenon flos-aquae 2012/KM1/D3]|nr:hypothetical protein OA07_17035 [Aphanizomenon flos-aquae 2012/KM1/D3]
MYDKKVQLLAVFEYNIRQLNLKRVFEKLWLMYQIFFYPTLTLPLVKGRELDFYCFPPLQGGTKGGSNVMKITEYHFSNILLKVYGYRRLEIATTQTKSTFVD